MGGLGPLPVVVDCDPGIDDAVALALIAASEELDLRAVTAVSGNVGVDAAVRNAARILRLLGRDDVPVAAGAARPLVRATPPYPPIHGANGVGGVELPPAAGEVGAGPALELLTAVLAAAEPRSVALVALGPLTNVALLLALRPELTDRLACLLTMGASYDRGNVTPHAEFNVWVDPEAAHRVLAESDLPVRLFTLGATRRAALDEGQRQALGRTSAVGEVLAQMMLGYADIDTSGGWPLHDAIVVAELIDPGIVDLRPATVTVDTGTGARRGATEFDFEPASPSGLEAGVGADGARFRELLSARIARF